MIMMKIMMMSQLEIGILLFKDQLMEVIRTKKIKLSYDDDYDVIIQTKKLKCDD